MQIAYYFVAETVATLLAVISLAMLVRAILSFIPDSEDWALTTFLYYVTEPAVLPVRLLLSLFTDTEDSPIDFAFFLAYLLLGVLQLVLPGSIL